MWVQGYILTVKGVGGRCAKRFIAAVSQMHKININYNTAS